MQIKEYEAFTLKECLQQVRNDLGPDAVILETRKFRKGGLLGWGARDAVCIVAAIGITVHNDLPNGRNSPAREPEAVVAAAPAASPSAASALLKEAVATASSGQSASGSSAAARNAFTKAAKSIAQPDSPRMSSPPASQRTLKATAPRSEFPAPPAAAPKPIEPARSRPPVGAPVQNGGDRLSDLERTMQEIKESLTTLKTMQQEGQERTVTAVVSAVGPALSAASQNSNYMQEEPEPRFPELHHRLVSSGVSDELAAELLESLPDFDAWNEDARRPLAEAALRDLISQRISSSGGIRLTPGQLKAVALIGPTGVGKTTTIAKLAAHFSLVEGKRVALLTVDTYRIAAVEQLKTYSQIIDIPIAVAYSNAEVIPAIEQFADYDLILIDTAGRSQKNVMQVGELKALLETARCETHLVLSAHIKESDMLEAVQRFSAARVDRLIFSKLDETSTYGSLLNVTDGIGIPLSYLTTGQKVPEDLEVADGARIAGLLLHGDKSREYSLR